MPLGLPGVIPFGPNPSNTDYRVAVPENLMYQTYHDRPGLAYGVTEDPRTVAAALNAELSQFHPGLGNVQDIANSLMEIYLNNKRSARAGLDAYNAEQIGRSQAITFAHEVVKQRLLQLGCWTTNLKTSIDEAASVGHVRRNGYLHQALLILASTVNWNPRHGVPSRPEIRDGPDFASPNFYELNFGGPRLPQ